MSSIAPSTRMGLAVGAAACASAPWLPWIAERSCSRCFSPLSSSNYDAAVPQASKGNLAFVDRRTLIEASPSLSVALLLVAALGLGTALFGVRLSRLHPWPAVIAAAVLVGSLAEALHGLVGPPEAQGLGLELTGRGHTPGPIAGVGGSLVVSRRAESVLAVPLGP